MNKYLVLVFASFSLMIFSCENKSASENEFVEVEEIESEIDELDSISNEIESSSEELDNLLNNIND